MANVFETLARNIKGTLNNIEILGAESIEETQDEFIKLNKEQLLQGEKSTGESLGFYKNRQYAIRKNQLNPLPGLGVKDYKLTGKYYAGIILKIEGGKIVMTSQDEKTKWLEKGSDERFGLNDENKSLYVEQSLHPVLIKKILNELIKIQ